MNRDLAREEFLRSSGWSDARRLPLPGDASTRTYTRLVADGKRAMLMDQPQQAEAPAASTNATIEERHRLGYNAVARLAGADCARFIAAADHLRQCGLAAPEIYDADIAHGFVLLEDFGDDLYAEVLARNGSANDLYGAAIDALVALHAHPAPAQLAGGKPLFAYDETAMLAEIDLLTEWFLPLAMKRPANEEKNTEHRALWRKALAQIEHRNPVFVHRDYHAQNLLWLPDRAGLARVGLIDFQDAVAGSPSYDIVSLLEDARRDVDPTLAQAMIERYLARARSTGLNVNERQFRAEAALLAAQRNAKIIGIFARLARRDGKTRYLAYLPRVWRYMEGDLAHPALAELKAWYDLAIPRDERVAAYGV